MRVIVLFLACFGVASSFRPQAQRSTSLKTWLASSALHRTPEGSQQLSRDDFLKGVWVLAGASIYSLTFPSPAAARGRATLEQSYDRYVPRILAGGEFYGKDFRKLVEKNDWSGIKNALQDPPKRTKEDRSKIDGGISERAAQAGQFSDARVLVAADLFAAAFSDNSISSKTKSMKTEVEVLREVVDEMNLAARQALGEEGGGGLFGFGAKKPSQSELSRKVRELFTKGGNAWNKYIFLANEELPVQLKKLPYIK